VHIAQPDGKLMPFEAFNLFYRDGRATRLEELRREVRKPFAKESPAQTVTREETSA
jgi:7,8-dihydro-6-hydroxymethylpterin dimethyltransferase